MDFKQIATLESKYIKGIHNVVEYTKDGRSHGAPRIFGTYTGRMTYSSMTLKKEKFKIGIAQHQVPRKGPTKSFIKPPEGYLLGEFDAAGQESRGMAIMSKDEAMLNVFRDGLDFHGMTGSRIAGMEYEAFVKAFHEEDKYAENQRYNGKFVNLSCNYRIGDTALRKKAFTQYDIVVNHGTAAMWNKSFKTMYPGVPAYWDSVCKESRQRGYTETLAGRRYQLEEWLGKKWVTESSAINFPIQGFGAEMKYLAIKTIFEKYPEVTYSLDVHDTNFYLIPDNGHAEELCLDVKETLNNLPYASAWSTDIPIPLLWDAKLGSSWKSLKEVGYGH
jgi:DNA polymerase-1